MFAPNDKSLLSNQDTNWFFDIGDDWIADLLFNYQRLKSDIKKNIHIIRI